MRAATYTLEYGMLPRNEPRERIATRTEARAAKNLALAFAAPFVTVAFVVAFPLVGLAMLAWLGVRAAAEHWNAIARLARNIALFALAPFVALAYTLAFPFVGLAMLAWVALRREPAVA